MAVAYREEAVAGRLDSLAVGEEVRALIRQTLVWIWKDEELHEEYLRGLLLERGGLTASLIVYGRALQGALSGWVSATENHLDARSAPLRTGAASAAGRRGKRARADAPALKAELSYQTFRRYCALNVALEATAELAYRRLIELARDDEERATFARVREDEARHMAAFRILAASLTDADRLASSSSPDGLLAELAEVTPWFVPATLRARFTGDNRARAFGSGAQVAVRTGNVDSDKQRVLTECLDAAGLAELVPDGGLVAIRRVVHARLRPQGPVERQRHRACQDSGAVPTASRRGGRRRPRGTHGVRPHLSESLRRRSCELLRLRRSRVPHRRHQPRPAAVPVRARLCPASDQRNVAGSRFSHRHAETADRPDRVRPSRALDARRQHRCDRRDVLRRADAPTSARRR